MYVGSSIACSFHAPGGIGRILALLGERAGVLRENIYSEQDVVFVVMDQYTVAKGSEIFHFVDIVRDLFVWVHL